MKNINNFIKGVESIEKHGGPKWYKCCDVSSVVIIGELVGEHEHDREHTKDRAIFCPQAIELAVISYACEVEDMYNEVLHPCYILLLGKKYRLTVERGYIEYVKSYHETRLAASVAMIISLGEMLEKEENDRHKK